MKQASKSRQERIAVLIPALNEEQTIADVVHGFRAACPEARIIIFDNASTDGTARRARAAGAEVWHEPRRGKGNVVQSMFRSIDADVYVMVDGDATYPPERVLDLIRPVLDGSADMVIGSRLLHGSESDFRALNRIGNVFYATLLRRLFGFRVTDLLSGYRALEGRLSRCTPFIADSGMNAPSAPSMIVRPSLSNHACALTRPSSFATPSRSVAACPCRASINIAARARVRHVAPGTRRATA